jgi:hypothetical protein
MHHFGWQTLREETTWEIWIIWKDNIKIDLKEIYCELVG